MPFRAKTTDDLVDFVIKEYPEAQGAKARYKEFTLPHGTHAAAVLVHDQHVDDSNDDVTREEADESLIEALGACQRPVAFLRRSMIERPADEGYEQGIR
jgi:hypothetical protein